METKQYIMWSDGVVSSFGELVSRDGATISVKNPVVVMFQVVNEPIPETDEKGNLRLDDYGQPIFKKDDKGEIMFKSTLKWDMNPYVFGACIKEANTNVWSITPSSIIEDGVEFDDRLISHYKTLVKLCGKTTA